MISDNVDEIQKEIDMAILSSDIVFVFLPNGLNKYKGWLNYEINLVRKHNIKFHIVNVDLDSLTFNIK